jgi:hypothetical protein
VKCYFPPLRRVLSNRRQCKMKQSTLLCIASPSAPKALEKVQVLRPFRLRARQTACWGTGELLRVGSPSTQSAAGKHSEATVSERDPLPEHWSSSPTRVGRMEVFRTSFSKEGLMPLGRGNCGRQWGLSQRERWEKILSQTRAIT